MKNLEFKPQIQLNTIKVINLVMAPIVVCNNITDKNLACNELISTPDLKVSKFAKKFCHFSFKKQLLSEVEFSRMKNLMNKYQTQKLDSNHE